MRTFKIYVPDKGDIYLSKFKPVQYTRRSNFIPARRQGVVALEIIQYTIYFSSGAILLTLDA